MRTATVGVLIGLLVVAGRVAVRRLGLPGDVGFVLGFVFALALFLAGLAALDWLVRYDVRGEEE